jgi:hypothetical protein
VSCTAISFLDDAGSRPQDIQQLTLDFRRVRWHVAY